MNFDITHEGRTTVAVSYADAIGLGYPAAVVGAALKAAATRATERVADDYRARVSSASAGKLVAYRIKEEIVGDIASAAPNELALFDREGSARGLTRDEHVAIVKKMAGAFRAVALLIETIEAEAKVAIATIPADAADIETQITTALAASAAEAEAAFAEAAKTINGGSQ